MHHLSNHDIARIQWAARQLPRVQRKQLRSYTGSQLIEMGITHHNGQPVEATGIYQVETIREVNLAALIIAKCREQGMDEFDRATWRMRFSAHLESNGTLHLHTND
jgi:hypothetical protein